MATRINLAILALACAAPSMASAADTPASGSDTAQLEEIVITAQKRTERLSDVPVSAAVLGSDTIARNNAGDISDLNRLVPSVSLNGTINGRVPMGIRGISSVSNEGTVGLSSGVAIMIDGVPVPSDSRAGNALEDVQSIEVLKGPQATLGGRTAASGVINIVTRKPTDTFQGNISALLTNDHEYRLNGYISGPIADKVDYSLAAYGTTRDFPINNLNLDENTRERIYGVRGKLLLKPTEDLDITLAARIGKDNSRGFNFVYTHLSPGIHLLTGAGGPPFLAQDALLPGITPDQKNLDYSSPVEAFSNVKDTDGSLDVQWRVGGLTLGSTTAYQHEQQLNVQDLFAVNSYFWNELTGAGNPGAPPPFFNQQTQHIDIKQFSQELKLLSPTDQTFSYLVGMFYSDMKIHYVLERGLLPAFQNLDVQPDTKTTDLYARGTWKFAPDWSLTAGLRYNYDQISYSYLQSLYTASFPPPVIYADLSASDSASESTVVGDLSLQRRLGADAMLYFTYARGTSPAAYNTAANLTPESPTLGAPVKKENVDHFELGTKGSYFDRRLTLNAAIWDTKYKDFQVQIFDQRNTSISPPLVLANAGEAETRGLEVDAAVAATDTLRINLSAAYIDAKFKDYKGAPCHYPDAPGVVPAGCVQLVAGGPVTQDLSGKGMPNSPKFKSVLSVEKRQPLGSGAYELVFGGTWSYRSSAQMLVDQNPYAIQSAFSIVNLDVGVRDKSGRMSVTAFVNNLTDHIYYTDFEDFWSSPWGATNTVTAQPARDARRYYGVRFSYGF